MYTLPVFGTLTPLPCGSALDAAFGVQCHNLVLIDESGQRSLGRRAEQSAVIQFEYVDAPDEMRLWWLLIETGDVDLRFSDPSFEVDLYMLADVRTMAKIWIGKDTLGRALDADDVVLHGNVEMRCSFGQALQLSPIVEANRQPLRLQPA